MKHLSLDRHIKEFLNHCKEEIHMGNLLRVKALVIGGAGLKMLASQSLMLHLLGVKLATMKIAIAKFGLFTALSSTTLFSGILGTHAAGGFIDTTVSPEGLVSVSRELSQEDPQFATISTITDTVSTQQIQFEGPYAMGVAEFMLDAPGEYIVLLKGYDEQETFIDSYETVIERIDDTEEIIENEIVENEIIAEESTPQTETMLCLLDAASNLDYTTNELDAAIDRTTTNALFNDTITFADNCNPLQRDEALSMIAQFAAQHYCINADQTYFLPTDMVTLHDALVYISTLALASDTADLSHQQALDYAVEAGYITQDTDIQQATLSLHDLLIILHRARNDNAACTTLQSPQLYCGDQVVSNDETCDGGIACNEMCTTLNEIAETEQAGTSDSEPTVDLSPETDDNTNQETIPAETTPTEIDPETSPPKRLPTQSEHPEYTALLGLLENIDTQALNRYLQDLLDELETAGVVNTVSDPNVASNQVLGQLLEAVVTDNKIATLQTMLEGLEETGNISINKDDFTFFSQEEFDTIHKMVQGTQQQPKLASLIDSSDSEKNTTLYETVQSLEQYLDNPLDMQAVLAHISTKEDITAFTNDATTYVLGVRKEMTNDALHTLINSEDTEKMFRIVEHNVDAIQGLNTNDVKDIIKEALQETPDAVETTIENTISKYAEGNTLSHFALQKVMKELGEDTDNDGVADIVEDTVSNGDANNDGMLDKQQRNVSTIPTTDGNKQITIDTTQGQACDTILSYHATSPESIGAIDRGYTYRYGLNRFELACDQATIKVFYHGLTIESLKSMPYRKYDSNDGYFDLPVTYGEENGVPFVLFTITDGSIYDDSPAGDGIIIDDNGPASRTSNLGGVISSINPDEHGTAYNVHNVANTSNIALTKNVERVIKKKSEHEGKLMGTFISKYYTGQIPGTQLDKNNENTYKKPRFSMPVGRIGRYPYEYTQRMHGSAQNNAHASIHEMLLRLLDFDTILQYGNSKLFDAQAIKFYKLVINDFEYLSPEEQQEKMQTLINNLNTMDTATIQAYGIDKEAILTAFNFIYNCSMGVCMSTN